LCAVGTQKRKYKKAKNVASKKKAKKLGAKDDPLTLANYHELVAKIKGKPVPQPPRPPTKGYAFIEYRKGRPYYYRRYYISVGNKRLRKKEYLGKNLPKGMKIKGKRLRLVDLLGDEIIKTSREELKAGLTIEMTSQDSRMYLVESK